MSSLHKNSSPHSRPPWAKSLSSPPPAASSPSTLSTHPPRTQRGPPRTAQQKRGHRHGRSGIGRRKGVFQVRSCQPQKLHPSATSTPIPSPSVKRLHICKATAILILTLPLHFTNPLPTTYPITSPPLQPILIHTAPPAHQRPRLSPPPPSHSQLTQPPLPPQKRKSSKSACGTSSTPPVTSATWTERRSPSHPAPPPKSSKGSTGGRRMEEKGSRRQRYREKQRDRQREIYSGTQMAVSAKIATRQK